ncbi:cation diffusion facilitator family transporter [Romeriopsis navalis]|nr:cation diffusion facilitator family transporter [Romeriopsis navalis]
MHQHSDNCHHDQLLDPTAKRKQLAIALILIGGFAAIEWGAGQLSHSLALVAEAGHMVSDCFALGLALAATFITQPALRDGWIGQHRLEVNPDRRAETWAALINGVGLVLLAGWISWEAWESLHQPALEIATLPMLLTAIVGVVINGINVKLLHQGSSDDLNLKGAYLHMIADMASAIGVIIAAVLVAVFHWMAADCVISFGIAGLILVSALPLVQQSWQQLQASGRATD